MSLLDAGQRKSQGNTSGLKVSKDGGVDSTNIKCEHMWPTPADMALLKGKPRSEWIPPEPISVQQIDFYLGRVPEWYIEQKFLKKPGDYLLARGHDNKLRLSVKSNEPGYPAIHFPIEFCQTKQVRGDRNYYYRIEKTVLQNRSVWGLIHSYQKSNVNSLKLNTKRDVRLIDPVLPCQGCRHLKTEYSFMNMQIKDKSEINIGELLCKGERSTIYKGIRYLTKKGLIKTTTTERPIILKEMDEYTATVLDNIFMELHIVNTIRHQIGAHTALSVEAIMVISRPYYIAYALCRKGSLLQYLEKTTVDMNTRVKKIPVIHGNLRAKNIFVDMNDDKIAKPIYYIGGFQYAVMARSKVVDPNKLANKRWLAPEVIETKLLTPESDVFAFGFLMYEVLTMKTPYETIADGEVLDYINKNPNVRPTVPATVPNWLRELVNECWSACPQKRPKMSDIWQQFQHNEMEDGRIAYTWHSRIRMRDSGLCFLQLDGNISVSTVESLRSVQEIDTMLNTTQYYFLDDDFFLVKVTQALFEDFQTKCMESENVDESPDLVSLFYEICSDGIAAFQKVSMRPEKTTALVSVLQQLLHEKQAYLLLLNLAKMNRMLDDLKNLEKQSILADLLVSDVEFRRLLVLLEWCEENAYSEPEANAELSEECANLEKNCMLRWNFIRLRYHYLYNRFLCNLNMRAVWQCRKLPSLWAETLHARIRGEKLCDLDLDGALHGRLHNKDEELEGKVFSMIYTLVRCGRIDEASALLEKTGLSSLAPVLQLRKMSRYSALTPSSTNETFYYLARSRSFLKQTIDKIISKGTSLSQVEACLWSVVVGRLEPALSLSSRTEDRLWCYLNAAVESRLDAAITIAHNGDFDVGIGHEVENDDLRINSIFDEIATVERSPYYTIYRHIVNDDSLSLIAFMDMWLEQYENDLERFPHVIRFMAHLVLLLQFTGRPVQEESANSIIKSYVRLLITLKLYPVVPYYANKLPVETAEEMVADFMCQIEDENMRKDVLAAVFAAKMDGVHLCKQIFNRIIARYPQESEKDDTLINAWSWLTYPHSDTYYEALLGMNKIMRQFFHVDKLDKAKKLLQRYKKLIDKILESLCCTIETSDVVEPKLSGAITEYRAYECYLNALIKFNEWFKQSQRSVPSIPVNSDDAKTSMDMQQRITFEVIHRRANEQLQRYENASKQSIVAALEALDIVLRFPRGWMTFTEAETETLDEEEVRKLTDIRSRYITAVVVMLVTIFEKSDLNGSAQLVELLADDEYMLAEVIPKERLRILIKQLSVNAYKSL
uniref:Protein kinase domain-containing protein n=1 Tax=Setaria digitata TaxID=48799 RepID=A0A915PRY1_9BILA